MLKLTVIGVPFAAWFHVVFPVQETENDVGVIPRGLRSEFTRVCTSLSVLPLITATRHPSRAAVVIIWLTIPSRDVSICPITSITNTGMIMASSTALVPERSFRLVFLRFVTIMVIPLQRT